MGKKGLSGASQSNSISVFSPLYIIGLSQIEQSSVPRSVGVQGQLCLWGTAHLLEVSSPQGRISSAGCCVRVTDITLMLMYYLRTGGTANLSGFLAPVPSGMQSNCCQWSPEGN